MAYERDVDIRVESQEADPSRKADGTMRPARATADGSLFVADWLMAHLLDGRLFSVNVGTGTTPVASAGAWVATTPDLHLQIPTNVEIIPVSLSVSIDSLVDDQDLEIVAATSNGRDASPTGGTTQTILNRNQTHSRGSRCIAQSDVTAITTPVTDRDYFEFWRQMATLGAAPVAAQSEEGQPTTFKWSYVDGPLAATGAAELLLWVAGGATFNYFATLTWVELPA